jgi:hypothetical protein
MSDKLQLKMVLIAIVGIFIGVLGTLGIQWYRAHTGPYHGVEPYIVEGYCAGTTANMEAMGVSETIGGGGPSYKIAGAEWREFGGSWNDMGYPPSLEWPSYGQKVRLGVIDYKPVGQYGGGSVVVWYEVVDVEHKIVR